MWAFPSADVSDYNMLVLHVKADQAISDVGVRIRDTQAVEAETRIDLGTEWQQIIIPVSDLVPLNDDEIHPDLTILQGVFMIFDHEKTDPGVGVVYIDLVGFIHADAEEPIEAAEPIGMITLIDKTGENLPVEIGSGGNARSAALYMNRYVVVASREGGPNVWVWDSHDPDADPVALDMGEDIIAPLTFPINYVRTAGDAIYVSNLSLNPTGTGWAQGVFRVYRWNGLDSEPEIVISYEGAEGRLGDAFSIIGDPKSDGHIIAHINTVGNRNQFRVWTFEDGELINKDEPGLLTLDVAETAVNNHGIFNPIEGEDGLFVVTSNLMGILIANLEGEVLAHWGTDIIDSRTYDPNIFYHKGRRFLSYTINNEGNPQVGAKYQVVDISLGDDVVEAINTITNSDELAKRVVYSKSLGAGHPNLTGINSIGRDAYGRVMILAHVVGRGFVLEATEPEGKDPLVLTTLADKTGANLPAEIGSGGNARSGALYMNRYAVVASREGGPNVWVWDSYNPDLPPVALDMGEDIIAPLTFPINYVRVAGDAIYVSNLSLNPTGTGWAQGVFRVYRWNDLDSEPEIVISYEGAEGRLGDAFSIIGDPKTNGHIIAHINTTKDFRVWTFEDGVLTNESVPDMITLDLDVAHINNHGIYNAIPGEEDLFLVTSNNIGIMVANIAGEILASWNTALIDMRTYDPNIFYYDGKRYLTYTINNEGNPAVGARYQVIDISHGDNVIEAFEHITDSDMLNLNLVYDKALGAGHPNLTAINQVSIDDDGHAIIFAHVVGRGFVVETTGAMPQKYMLSLQVEPEDAGTVTGGGSYTSDVKVVVTAEPAEGYLFEKWTDADGELLSEEPEYAYTMSAADVTLKAVFVTVPVEEVATLAELRTKPADGTLFKYTGEAVIVAMDGFRNRKFLQDETAAIMIDDQPGVITTGYELYDVVTNVVGKLNLFRQLLQFQPEENTAEAVKNTPVAPVDFALDEVTPNDQAKLIRFTNVHFDFEGDAAITVGDKFVNGRNYTITDGENTFVLRTDFFNVDYIGTEIPTGSLHISGVIIQFNEILQIVPRFADDMQPAEEENLLVLNVKMAVWANYYQGFDPEKDFVDVAGTFNNWGETPLVLTAVEDDPYMTYTITIHELEVGTEYGFKFRINGSWADDMHEFPSGGPDRKITMEEGLNVHTFWFNDEDETTSVSDPSQASLRLYPNPAREMLHIESGSNIEMIRMVNMTGQVVYQQEVNNDQVQLYVDQFDAGMYLMQVITSNGVSVERFIISR